RCATRARCASSSPASRPTAAEPLRNERVGLMSESIFLAAGECFAPTEQARGPWDPNALHGGAPAALIASAFERVEPGAGLRVGRLPFEFLRPIPMAPLALSTSIVRPGRRVQELTAELRAGEEVIVRAGALRVQDVPREAVDAVAEIEAGDLLREDESP